MAEFVGALVAMFLLASLAKWVWSKLGASPRMSAVLGGICAFAGPVTLAAFDGPIGMQETVIIYGPAATIAALVYVAAAPTR